MTDWVPTRSRWSTGLVSFLAGPFGGFLWIGSGKLAVLSLVVLGAVGLYFSYFGFPLLPGLDASIGDLAGLFQIAFNLISVAIVVPFAKRFRPDKWYSRGLSVLGLAFVASFLAAFLIRSFILQPFSIPAGSMAPTLLVGDHLFVSKMAYGYSRYSVPFGLLPVEGRIFAAEPERGDVVVFKTPSDPRTDYIKRVIGLPGDEIQMIDGVLHINDVAVKLEDTGTYSDAKTPSATLQRETLPNGVSYFVLDQVNGSQGDHTGIFVVPAGHYFMLGDHRDNSADSRFNLGFIPYENLIGKAVRLFWNSQGTEYLSRQTLEQSTID